MTRIVSRPNHLDLDSPGRRDYGVALEHDSIWGDHLIGENPLETERLWQKMYRRTMYCGRRSVTISAIVALLMASTARADIRVLTDFEGGNAEVIKLDQATSTVRIMPEIRLDRGWPCWWFLQVEGLSEGLTLTLEVQAQTQRYGEKKPVLSPTWCQPKHASVSTDGVTWKPSAKAEFTPDKVAIYKIPASSSRLWLAWGPPFLPSQAEAWLTGIAARLPEAKTFELARTRGHRPVPGIRMGAVDAPRQVWINARQHAWEAGGSWVCRGLVEWIASDVPAARELRAQTCIHCIPIMDVDNVTLGAGGKDATPRDHNRDWADQPNYPEVTAAQRRIMEIERTRGLDVYLDLHNPGPDDPIFFFGPFDYEKLPAISQRNYQRWIELAASHMKKPLNVQPKYLFATYVSSQEERSRMSSSWAREHISERGVSLVLETAWNSLIITQDSYQLVGAQLGQALAEYLKENPRRD